MNERKNPLLDMEIDAEWGIYALDKAVQSFQASDKPDWLGIMTYIKDAMKNLRRIQETANGLRNVKIEETKKMLDDIFADSLKKSDGF